MTARKLISSAADSGDSPTRTMTRDEEDEVREKSRRRPGEGDKSAGRRAEAGRRKIRL